MRRRPKYDFTSRDISRLSTFSDAIFAIALTLPVLELRLPSASHTVQEQLSDLWPAFLAYLVTFFVGIWHWSSHYNLFDSVTEVNEGAVNRNSLYLFLFSLLPFSTSTIMVHGREPLAVVLYALNLAALSLVLAALKAWLLKNQLIVPDRQERIRGGMRLFVGVGLLFIVQGLIGVVQPRLALFVPFAIPVVFFVVRWLERRSGLDVDS